MNRKVVENELKTLGFMCKNLREKKKWSQKQLAAVIECKQQTISKFEKGMLNNLYLYSAYQFFFGEPL